LVISGHPDLNTSAANSLTLNRLSSEFSDIEIRKLDELYETHKIDVEAEQQALLAADTIVFQFPFYWYSVPGLMKTWIDSVLTYGFAYGSEGDKLKGKKLVLSFTMGGPEEAYCAEGFNNYTIEELIKPLVQTANLTQMELQPPVYSHGVIYIPGVYNTPEIIEERAGLHADKLIAALKALV